MNKIEVKLLPLFDGANPEGMMMFLANLTQKGHNIHNMDDLYEMFEKFYGRTDYQTSAKVARLPHGTITRFVPLTFAIVGASRRFLAQIRTHQVGATYVSASLQYSDYSGSADFTIPYEMLNADYEFYIKHGKYKVVSNIYLNECTHAMSLYSELAKQVGNDAAGYTAPQGLRNILIIQLNAESLKHIIRLRACNRNTLETQFVVLKMWEEAIRHYPFGAELFEHDAELDICPAGPDCMTGKCHEGKFSCGKPIMAATPTEYLKERFPLLYNEEFINNYK